MVFGNKDVKKSNFFHLVVFIMTETIVGLIIWLALVTLSLCFAMGVCKFG